MLKNILSTKALVGLLLAVSIVTIGFSQVANAKCRTGDFQGWLRDFKRQAAAKGISGPTIRRGLRGITYDASVVKKDNSQSVFSQTFLKFSGRMISGHRLKKGAQMKRKYASTFREIKRRYGVPAEVLIAFWGLETDFGAFLGSSNTLRSLATMAYDCRRTELFHKELFSALKIIERGDLSPREMRGPWAGELGQLQFLPSHYIHYGVDMDGDGRVQLLTSSPDALGSAANYIKSLGWKRNEPWLIEVKVPRNMPWEQAEVDINHSRSQWSKWGVRRKDGRPIRADNMKASLLLPMGKDGPAFLAFSNFTKVYLEWNHSLIYSTTAAYFATRLTGASRVSKGRGISGLDYSGRKQIQRLLQRRGFDVGKVDGILGYKSRVAVRAMQKRHGLAQDGYPTSELLSRMKNARPRRPAHRR